MAVCFCINSANTNPMLLQNKNVYVVRSRPDHHLLKCDHESASYIIAFANRSDASRVVKQLSSSSKVYFHDFQRKAASVVAIEKKININKLPCIVQEKAIMELIDLPVQYNVGVAFAFDMLVETDNEFMFRTHQCEAIPNVDSFKSYVADLFEVSDGHA